MGQMQLQEIHLEKSYVGEFKNSDLPKLSAMMTQNERTLRYINLTVSSPDHELLNGTLFQNCTNLKTLIFGESPDVLLEFYNLCDLPKSLKTLKISPILVLKTEDKVNIGNFKHLEALQLLEIHLPMTSSAGRHGFLIQFLKSLLRLRQLSKLFIEVSPSPSPTPTYSKELNAMISGFSARHWLESKEEFRTLEIYGKHDCFPKVNFLDTCPMSREKVDPRAKVRATCTGHSSGDGKVGHGKHLDCNTIPDILVNSNIFHVTEGGSRSRRRDDDEATLCDFCTGLYILDD